MRVLLTTYNSIHWPQFLTTFGLSGVVDLSLKADEVLNPVQSLADLTHVLNQSTNIQVCLAIVQAEYSIAEAIDKNENLSIAAKRWQTQTQALLDLQRKYRRQLQLFNLHHALIYPDIFIEKFNYPGTLSTSAISTPCSELSLLAACQYIDQHVEFQPLNTRLLATVLPLVDSAKPQVDIESFLQKEKLKQEEKKAADLLLTQLHNVQEQLESQLKLHAEYKTEADKANTQSQESYINSQKKLQKIQAECEKLQQELIQNREEQNKLKASNAAVANERDLILAQLHQVQEKVEEYYLALKSEEQKNKHTTLARDKQYAKEIQKMENELRKANARAASAEYNLGLLQKELSEHRNSTLWKATSPMRILGGLVRRVDKSKEKLQQDIGLLLTSEYFDVEWYLRHYPDVAESKMNPAEHYLLYGATEGRLPGPLFDGNWYLQQYSDVAEAGTNPLLHFITYGLQEGRNSSPKFLMSGQTNEEPK